MLLLTRLIYSIENDRPNDADHRTFPLNSHRFDKQVNIIKNKIIKCFCWQWRNAFTIHSWNNHTTSFTKFSYQLITIDFLLSLCYFNSIDQLPMPNVISFGNWTHQSICFACNKPEWKWARLSMLINKFRTGYRGLFDGVHCSSRKSG